MKKHAVIVYKNVYFLSLVYLVLVNSLDSLLSVSIDGDVDAARKMEEAAQNSENVMSVIQNGNDSESDQDDPDDQGYSILIVYFDLEDFVFNRCLNSLVFVLLSVVCMLTVRVKSQLEFDLNEVIEISKSSFLICLS